ncbi:GIY-YIG nuclease family protein [Portibacter marinus]|uniref:GIY-YIG nuclease family protein n=1 Tax=Portibacter marinus TaxID=2898660 RepID=UPI001F2CCCD0|nr:GIY-YIG nuclease family protein [Portibacter marinus]
MRAGYELSIEVSEPYPFDKKNLPQIVDNKWVKNQWPIVYFINSNETKKAYVGESTNFSQRVKNHLKNKEKSSLNMLSIIGSDKFNKSATLDIESKLIQYLSGEGSFELLNGNFGLINHNYYQQDIYANLFSEIWNKLLEKKVVSKTLEEIENSELFKYSPYKSLSEDQYYSVIELLEHLTHHPETTIVVKGSTGTGKTILASYLLKLLYTNVALMEEETLNESEKYELELI